MTGSGKSESLMCASYRPGKHELAEKILPERQNGDKGEGEKEGAQNDGPIKESLLHTPPGAEHTTRVAAAQSPQAGLLALQDDDGNQYGAQDYLGNTQICLHKTSDRFNDAGNAGIISETILQSPDLGIEGKGLENAGKALFIFRPDRSGRADRV
jgi:hypothetical protein